ncbi:MAG: alpha/beta hydrolase [Burkholderiaceae bacterium]
MLTDDEAIAGQWGAQLRHIDVGAVSLRVAVAGNGPLVILVHGFPESWYSWRRQIEPLTSAGFQVAVPDVRGYGGSDKPHPVSAYDMESLTGDIRGLALALSPQAPAVVIGHDWGAPIAWNSALLFPEQFLAVAGLSVPYVPPGDVVAIDLFRKLFTDKGKFFYMVYFQDEGVAEAELEADPFVSIHQFYTCIAGDAPAGAWPRNKLHGQRLFDDCHPPSLPRPWLDTSDVAYYASQFAESGFRGPLNRYRNFHRDNAFLKSRGDLVIHQPSLFIGGEKDMVNLMYPAGPVEALKPYLSHLSAAHLIDGCGHWTQQERPGRVNQILIDWLRGL